MASVLYKGGESVRVETNQIKSRLDNGWSANDPSLKVVEKKEKKVSKDKNK